MADAAPLSLEEASSPKLSLKESIAAPVSLEKACAPPAPPFSHEEASTDPSSLKEKSATLSHEEASAAARRSHDAGSVHRNSHDEFFDNRDWDVVSAFWRWCLNANEGFPSFVYGHQDELAKGTENSFGVNQCKIMQDSWVEQGLPIFEKYRNPDRVTFALRIGYAGHSYSGYQKQKAGLGIHTVEDDLEQALHGQKSQVAGRTDKDVSAVSQVISFHTREKITPKELMTRARDSEALKNGNITVFECCNMPRRFHALFIMFLLSNLACVPPLPSVCVCNSLSPS